MKMLFALAAFATLAACATTKTAAGETSDARDCAVFTAVLQQHYQLEPNTPYKLDRGGSGPSAVPGEEADYRVTCDFKKDGIALEDYVRAPEGQAPVKFQAWIKLLKPTYPYADTAVVETGSLLGPLAGSGQRCTLQNVDGHWLLHNCEMTWIS